MNRFEYFIDGNGKRQWKEYDENNNLVNCSIPSYKEWNESDDNGNIIHHKRSTGFECWCEYDENNRMIHFKSNEGIEEFYTYLDEGYIAHCKYPDGKEEKKRFDNNDNLLYIVDSDGDGYNCFDFAKEPKALSEYLSNKYGCNINEEKSHTLESLLDDTITELTNIRFTSCDKDEVILLLQNVLDKLNNMEVDNNGSAC
jgi:hypothetical protein